MLSKLILSDKVKANYDPITHFLKMKQLYRTQTDSCQMGLKGKEIKQKEKKNS